MISFVKCITDCIIIYFKFINYYRLKNTNSIWWLLLIDIIIAIDYYYYCSRIHYQIIKEMKMKTNEKKIQFVVLFSCVCRSKSLGIGTVLEDLCS